MVKTTKTFTIEAEVWEKAKRSGVNMSKVVEKALAEACGVENIDQFATVPRDKLKIAVNKVRTIPGSEVAWAERLNKWFGTEITPEVLKKYAQLH